MNYLLGIDLGTSSVKVGLFDSQTLTLVTSASQAYPIHHPRPNFAEQHPEDWWTAVSKAVSQVTKLIDRSRIAGIGVDGQMHGVVCIGNSGEPICPAIIWSDNRSTESVAFLRQLQPQLTAVLPGPPSTGFAASTLHWLSQNQPEIMRKTAVFLQPKDYIQYRLSGVFATEPSDASSSWLYDIEKQSWASDVLEACGILSEQLPPIVSSTDVVGTLQRETAVSLTLPEGIPIVAGAADLAAQVLGHGVTETSQTIVTVGSGGQVVVPQANAAIDTHQRTYTFNHCLPNLRYKQAAILSAGLSLNWFSQLLNPKQTPNFEHLSTMASSVQASQEGLFFLPYLSGERTPLMNPNASGVFFGLQAHHTQAHLARAVMEGVGFALMDCLNVIDSHSQDEIVLSGGITKSPFWSQLVANIWQRPLRLSDPTVPRATLGSALLAGLGVGLWSSIEEVRPLLPHQEQRLQPNTEKSYQSAYEKYGRLYQCLKDEMV